MKRVDQENRVQAEIAAGSIASPHQVPAPGQCLRPFTLRSTHGHLVGLSNYRDRSAVVPILSDGTPEADTLMRDSARQYDEIRKKGAEVLAIVCGSREEALSIEKRLTVPFPVLLDEGEKLHRELGAMDEHEHCASAVYVIDRFGEVFASYRAVKGDALPDVGKILSRIEFISFQCPECEPPEWPA